jgi:hypothetical protein
MIYFQLHFNGYYQMRLKSNSCVFLHGSTNSTLIEEMECHLFSERWWKSALHLSLVTILCWGNGEPILTSDLQCCWHTWTNDEEHLLACGSSKLNLVRKVLCYTGESCVSVGKQHSIVSACLGTIWGSFSFKYYNFCIWD